MIDLKDTENDEAIDHDKPSTSSAGGAADLGNNEETMKPKLWEDTYTSIVTLCLFSVSGMLLICLPLLPNEYSNGGTTVIIRMSMILAFSLFGLLVMASLLRNKEKLHRSGLVLQPHKCKHCFRIFTLFELDRKAPPTTDLNVLRTKLDQLKGTESSLPTNKSPLYITFIFSAFVIGFSIFNLSSIVYCSFVERSQPGVQTNPTYEIVLWALYEVSLIATVAFVSFCFIPSFYDAYFVGILKIRWSLVLIVGVSAWIAFLRLTSPFETLTASQSPLEYTWSNCTLADIGYETAYIAKPFTVELPIMIASFMIELWSHLLPRYVHSLSKHSSIPVPDEPQKKQRKLRIPISLWKRYFADSLETRPLVRAKYESRSERILFEGEAKQGSNGPSPHHRPKKTTKNQDRDLEKNDNSPESNQAVASSETKRKKSTRLSRRVELSIAIMLILCGVYFTTGKFLLGDYTSESADKLVRFHYIQWLARMAFYTPELLLIAKQRRLTRRSDGSYNAKQNASTGVQGINLFIILMTGSAFYQMFCLAAPLGNLIYLNPRPDTDTITLNAVSAVLSIFEIFRMSFEAVFLLRVQRQRLKNSSEREWTLLCLMYMGMANATQWMWDGFIHEMDPGVAWPDLLTFFEKDVGEVLGLFLAPVSHLYEFHVAIFALENFAKVRSSDPR